MRCITASLLFATMMALIPSQAEAYKINEDHQVYGYAQLWMLISEDANDGDTVQTADGESGSTTAFGFKDRRMRVGFKGDLMQKAAFYNVFADGAGGTFKLVDYWFGLRGGGASLQFGRFRPFVTWEASMTSSAGLKNIDRDTGLTSITSAFFANNASWRDLGIQIVLGEVGKSPVAILFSVTDGTGANTTVGGDTSQGTVYSNAVGDAAYAVGAVFHLAEGAHAHAAYAMNKHTAATLSGAEKTAIDIDRTTYSVGMEYAMLGGLAWIDGEYASIKAGSKDFAFADAELTAWYARAGFYVMPNSLEIVARYATEADKGIVHGDPHHEHKTDETALTMNYYLDAFKAQLEYVATSPDGEDSYNSFRSNFQIRF